MCIRWSPTDTNKTLAAGRTYRDSRSCLRPLEPHRQRRPWDLIWVCGGPDSAFGATSDVSHRVQHQSTITPSHSRATCMVDPRLVKFASLRFHRGFSSFCDCRNGERTGGRRSPRAAPASLRGARPGLFVRNAASSLVRLSAGATVRRLVPRNCYRRAPRARGG